MSSVPAPPVCGSVVRRLDGGLDTGPSRFQGQFRTAGPGVELPFLVVRSRIWAGYQGIPREERYRQGCSTPFTELSYGIEQGDGRSAGSEFAGRLLLRGNG